MWDAINNSSESKPVTAQQRLNLSSMARLDVALMSGKGQRVAALSLVFLQNERGCIHVKVTLCSGWLFITQLINN
jgi:hypothetical protein